MKSRLIAILLGVVVAWISTTARAAIKSEDFSLRDERRGRDIECRVHFPDTGGSLPLIVFSHGFGGDRTAFTAIAQHWAEHGYVVVQPSHLDGFGRSGNLAESKPADAGDTNKNTTAPPAKKRLGALVAGGGLAKELHDVSKIEGRVADVRFVIDSAPQIVAKFPSLKGRLDPSRVGVGGHSFGAYTTMLIGGTTVDLGEQAGRSFRDPRVKCILPISAQGTGQQGLTKDSWSKLNIPMLTITGSRDQGVGGQGPEWRKEPFRFSPPGDKFLVFIEGATHVSFGGGLTGRETEITRIVKATSLTFWDSYLKSDAAATNRLKSSEILKPFASQATIESK